MRAPLAWTVVAIAVSVAAVVGAGHGNAHAEVPWLGISYEEQGGARVAEVHAGSAASACGLLADDILLAVDDIALTPGALAAIIRERDIGDTIRLRVMRGRKRLHVSATLTAKPTENELLHARLVGRRAPGWQLQRVGDGRWVDDRVAAGRVGVFLFFDLGCRSCAALANHIASWSRVFPEGAVVPFAIVGGDLETARAFASSAALTLPLLVDASRRPDMRGTVIRKYGVSFGVSSGGVTAVVADARGMVRGAMLVNHEDPAESAGLDDLHATIVGAFRWR